MRQGKSERTRWLECRFPPPVIFVAIGLAMWGFRLVVGTIETDTRDQLIAAGALAVMGIGFGLAGGLAFRRAGTTFDPRRLDDTSMLVVDGVYRLTRNPMYLGLGVILIAWSVFLGAPLTLVGPAAFAVYITEFQIKPEERVLARKFGEEYEKYCLRVRRWI